MSQSQAQCPQAETELRHPRFLGGTPELQAYFEKVAPEIASNPAALRVAISQGRLGCWHIGRRVYFTQEQADAYLERMISHKEPRS
jgi:hypothetical protein